MKKIIVLLSFLLFSLTLQAQELQAGAAMRNITPNPLIPVSGGVGIPNPATIKHGELTTRALVLTKNDTRIAIVAIDNLGIPKLIGDRSCVKIKNHSISNITY